MNNAAHILLISFMVFVLPNGCSGRDSFVQRDVMIPMQDGIKLATDIYFPAGVDDSWPVILLRTPYNKAFLEGYGTYYSKFKYIVAIQNVRGRFSSQGNWTPFLSEGQDGYDTVEWLAEQDWCTGKIGMVGGSYSGSVQFLTAIKRPPHLTTIVPNVAPAMPFDNLPYDSGVLQLGWAVRWTDMVENALTGRELQQKLMAGIKNDWYQPLLDLPVIDLDRKIIGKEVDYWRDWVGHNSYDKYWTQIQYLEQLEDLDIPVLLQSGWFDAGNRGSKLAFEHLRKSVNPNIRMIIGPWIHSDRGGRYLEGQDMGEAADIDLFDMYRRWFDYWLRGIDNGIVDDPPVQIFLMKSNYWLTGNDYPLHTTTNRTLYLAPAPHASQRGSHGILQQNPQSLSSAYDEYSYDPGSPTPSFYANLKRNNLKQYMDQIDSRDDVLVFETAPFEQAIDIAGPVTVVLYASSSAKDTDWHATLYGIDEMNNPYPIGLMFGVTRARFRNSRVSPELLEPGKVYEYVIDLSHTAITMPPGHRLRLEIASASFPEYSRNLNTGGHNEMESRYVTAEQKIYFSKDMPSRLVMPVLKK